MPHSISHLRNNSNGDFENRRKHIIPKRRSIHRAVYEKFGAGCSLAAKNTKDAKTGRAACPHAAESGKAALVAAVDVPFEIPANWRWVRLGNVIQLLSGRDLDPQYYNDSETGMVYITGASNLKDGNVIINRWTDHPQVLAQRDDLLLTCKGAGVGKFAFLDLECAHIARQIMALRVYKDIERKFVAIFVEYSVDSLRARMNGLIPGISRDDVLNLLFPLPPLAEQKRIVAKIEKLMPLVEEYGKMEETRLQLDADLPAMLEKSILQEAIQGKLVPQDPDDEPASELLKRIAAERKALVKAGKLKRDKGESVIFRGSDRLAYETRNGETVCIQDEIPFEIPDSWEWVRLGSVCSIVRGSGIKRSETIDSGSPCIRYGEIYTTYGYSFQTARSFTSESVTAKCHKAHAGDVLCTMTGECKEEIAKATAYLGTEAIAIGGDLVRISNHPYNPMLLVYFMFSPFMLSQKADKSNGDIIVHIGKEAIENLLIPLPPRSEQERIVAKVANLLSAIKSFTT